MKLFSRCVTQGRRIIALTFSLTTLAFADSAFAQNSSILQATLTESGQKTQEVSTADLRRIISDGSAIVLDSRKRSEFVAGHIPGARNIDAPPSEYIAAVERLVGGKKEAPLVLYCNGPFCQASRNIADQLVAAGFRNVRRYQLGMPVWRALGGPTEIELEGIRRIFNVDRTAVFFDARTADEFAKGSLPGAHNLPADKVAAEGLQKAAAGKLPVDDFNTRVVLFGRDSAQARSLADAFSKSPCHNVTYFSGTADMLTAAVIK